MIWVAECVFMGFILCTSGFGGQTVRICALKDSTVDLPCSARRPPSSLKWYTARLDGKNPVLSELSADGNHVTYNTSAESTFTLTIKDLSESDENIYCCRDDTKSCWENNIELHVSDLQVHVFPTKEGHTVSLMCSTSCALTENPVVYIWYKNGEFLYEDWSPWYQQLVSSEEAVTYSCAVKGHEHLRAPEVSVGSSSYCLTVNFASRRLCALEGSSVNFESEYTRPSWISEAEAGLWNKIMRCDNQIAENPTQDADRVAFHDDMKHHSTMTINNLKKNDSAEYTFGFHEYARRWDHCDLPTVTLVVTVLKVTVTPAADVTAGQKVTLTCSTSCPLTDTNYIWFFNGRPLTLTESQNKQLVLYPVRSQHAGNYSCAAENLQNISSPVETLTVEPLISIAILNAVKLTVLLLMAAYLLYMLVRKRTKLCPAAKKRDKVQTEQAGLLYESIKLKNCTPGTRPAEKQVDSVNRRCRF
ncbi:sialoadhesin-like isoform X2 [Plectropomus leopardus]|uniref:sialoadhesin-like isoform X2 n=1 Tax=Plectropomus leopardus TaxID=160734 RepID=UPI001C4AD920|nr:sialoadhesin-like isoform X2 [Plectropomus leopardus]